MTPYNKLVRDGIPAMIEAAGGRCETRILDGDELHAALIEKLGEEAREYAQSADLMELADVLEVVRALARRRGLTQDALEAMRKTKHRERGGFEGGTFLIATEP